MVFLLLLPSLHFWTSMPGKESLIFMLLCVLLYEKDKQRLYSVPVIVFILGVAVIRPTWLLVWCWIRDRAYGHPNNVRKQKILSLGAVVACAGLFAWLLVQLQDFSGGLQRVGIKYNANIARFKNYQPIYDWISISCLGLFTFYYRPSLGIAVGVCIWCWELKI